MRPIRTAGDRAAKRVTPGAELELVRGQLGEALAQQAATAEVLKAISGSAFDLRPVFASVVGNARKLCEAEFGYIYQREGDRFRLVATEGRPARIEPLEQWTRPVRGAMAGRVVLDRKTAHVHDIRADADFQSLASGEDKGRFYDFWLQLGYRSELAVPLLQDGSVVGIIGLARYEVKPFTDQQIRLVETFAAQAVIAIENVRLFNETKEALERQTATAEILRAISGSPTDVQPVLDAIAANAVRYCGAEDAALYLFHEGRTTAWAHVGPFPDQGSVEAMRQSPSDRPLMLRRDRVMGRAVLDRATIHLPDTQDPSAIAEFPDGLNRASGFPFRAVVVTPLMRKREAIGAIMLRRQAPGPFSAAQITLVETFADQAVIAIENVRLFNEVQEKSRLLEIASKHKSEFLANMSHELRTPLNAITGFSDVLIGGMAGQLDQKQTEYLQDIRSSGQHLLSLINDILDLSKVEAGRMELELSRFSLPEALRSVVMMVRERAAGRGVALTSEIGPRIDLVEADERKIKQVVLNLLTNAVKFTPAGGRVELSATRGQDGVVVAIRDTGVGIAPADQARVFEEFAQARSGATREQEGTGLGLTLSRKFVELHRGKIWVESEVGKGSTFSFAIPLGQPAVL